MLSTILIPTDFSPSARQAMHYAVKHFSQMHPRLILLHAYTGVSETAEPLIRLIDILESRAEEGLRREHDVLLQCYDCSQLDIARISSRNSLHAAIEELLGPQNVQLIVLGLEQNSPELQTMARQAGRPMLLVPPTFA